MSDQHLLFNYAGQTVALLTQHGKAQAIAPVLEPALGCRVVTVEGYDTDQLGTFTREIPRLGTQLEAARRKARIGMELSGLAVGLASEGSFSADPFSGMFPWNVELLVWIDERLGIEVMGMAQGPASGGHLLTSDWAAAEAFARREGFPAQQLVLRPEHLDHPTLFKGVASWEDFRARYEDCQSLSANGRVWIETDLRAHANPSRMRRIGEAATDLLHRLQSPCPACRSPGFAVTQRIPGLPCAACGAPTGVYRAESWQCPKCHHTAVVDRTDLTEADAKHCASCNP